MNTEKLEAQAAAWLIRSEATSFTAEDRVVLEEWLASSPHNRAVYMRLHAGWGQADQFRRLRPFDSTVNPNLLAESVLPSLRRADRAPLMERLANKAQGYALGIIGTALVLTALVLGAKVIVDRTAGRTYITDIGGFERVMLRDGSIVHMNTNSRIRVRFTKTQRKVLLDRGEARFTVASDRRPFDVEARGTTIRATGTVFSVLLRETAGVEVLVTEGHVAIDPPEGAHESITTLPRSVPELSAGETVTIEDNRLQVAKVGSAEAARKMAWMQGRLVFESQTLAAMAAEFNRYNRRQLVIADPAIAGLRMSAGFDATDPESFVAALERSYGVRASRATVGGKDIVRLAGSAP